MISDWMSMLIAPWASRPVISEPRRTGVTRKRSMTPRSRSSMTGIPAQPDANSAVITTTPGARKVR